MPPEEAIFLGMQRAVIGAQDWGEQGPEVLLTYLNARDHILALWPLEEANAHTLNPIPVAFILAGHGLVLALVSLEAVGANTDLPIPRPFIFAVH